MAVIFLSRLSQDKVGGIALGWWSRPSLSVPLCGNNSIRQEWQLVVRPSAWAVACRDERGLSN